MHHSVVIDTLDATAITRMLQQRFDPQVRDVALIGAGAWSRCFGFTRGGEALVVRVGRHGDDFARDAHAARYASPALPVPALLALGELADGYYAISTRAWGEPLEQLDATAWSLALPATVALLAALRQLAAPAGAGWGTWDAAGRGTFGSWSAYLLDVLVDSPASRTHGWRQRLGEIDDGPAEFAWGAALLQQIVDDAVPHGVIHGDLMHRNVLVDGPRISGVFDWGCAAYGDPLYDLAWFQFWAPWHPNLGVDALTAGLRGHAPAAAPADDDRRRLACVLHIGLGHLAYNAWLRDWPMLRATARRMRELVASTT
jgi:hygromycin-B 4-O-kinase